MSTTDNGGPAFPDEVSSGMSLRDYFAAAALQGLAVGLLVSDPKTIGSLTLKQLKTPVGEHDISLWAYTLADAMLTERSKATP